MVESVLSIIEDNKVSSLMRHPLNKHVTIRYISVTTKECSFSSTNVKYKKNVHVIIHFESKFTCFTSISRRDGTLITLYSFVSSLSNNIQCVVK